GTPSVPWTSKEEWELAEWLMSVHISQAMINRFLKLAWVRKHSDPLSFSSAKELHAKVRTMPGGPPWLSTEITLKDAPNEPQLLRYHNVLECVSFLFQNPSFKDCMDFSPKSVYKSDGKTQVYHEM
ncbi:hypothetical protein BS47DRAFT_1262194, partial [Hydnum rufescens UP504]